MGNTKEATFETSFDQVEQVDKRDIDFSKIGVQALSLLSLESHGGSRDWRGKLYWSAMG